ncbi:MAG: rhomboid family intramembrane serine protease [Candidatus Bathyarchaeota archaeon]|nr:rhomboid family intramembrane serine protease [Candidatus Bathyarchaeota archaeon]MDH5792003.1 rhomboid family intramembrane serine protease [Candidatus Bathyarchaeota archaeon]
MLPIGDENPTRLTPVVNWSIIAACILVFLWQTSSGSSFFNYTLFYYGVVPSRVAYGEGLYTFVTSTFLHGSWLHLLGNMLFLWIFGDNIEDCCGHLRYLAFYIACGVAASVLWIATAWGSPYPAVGASGAISGVLGAYFIIYPRRRIRTLIGLGIFWRVVRIPAYAMIGLWFAYQFMLALTPMDTGVAYWAHVGGFFAGIVLSRIIRPKLRVSTVSLSLDDYR